MSIELILILWVLCAGLSYFIARDRAPNKAPLATLLGFLLGPIGVGLTFLLKNENDEAESGISGSSMSKHPVSDTVSNAEMTKVLSADNTKSMEELKRDLEGLKTKLRATSGS